MNSGTIMESSKTVLRFSSNPPPAGLESRLERQFAHQTQNGRTHQAFNAIGRHNHSNPVAGHRSQSSDAASTGVHTL
jgi:hypothetical protein